MSSVSPGELPPSPRPHPDAVWDEFGSFWVNPNDMLVPDSATSSAYCPPETSLLKFAQGSGFNKLAVAFALIGEDNSLLMLRHREKLVNLVNEGQWSILTESIKALYDDDGNFIVGETIEETLWRSLEEEVGVKLKDAPDSGLFAESGFRQYPMIWDLSHDQSGSPEYLAMGYTVRILITDEYMQWILKNGKPTSEASRFGFFLRNEIEDIVASGMVRNGFPEWLDSYMFGPREMFEPDYGCPVKPTEPRKNDKFTWRGTRFAGFSGKISLQNTTVRRFGR